MTGELTVDSPADGPPIESPSLSRDTWLSTVGALGATGLSGISSVLIARGLGVTDRGRWAVISSLAVIVATTAGLGLPTAVAYAAARADGVQRNAIVRASLTAVGGLALLAAGAYLAAAAITHPAASTVAVGLGAMLPATTIVYTVAHQLSLTSASMRWYAGAQLVNAGAVLIAVVVIDATIGLTVARTVVISASGTSIGAAICLASLTAHGAQQGARRPSRPVDAVRVLRPYIAYAFVSFVGLSLSYVVQRLDILLVAGYRGAHAAGIYAVANQAFDLMVVIPAALGVVTFKRGAQASRRHLSDATTIMRWALACALAEAIVALVLAPSLVPFVWGRGYRSSVTPLLLLLPGMIAFSSQSVLSNYLAGRGRPRGVLLAWLIAAVASTVADLVVIPRYGVTGAAIVSSASYAMVMGLHVRLLRALDDQL